MGVIYCMMIEGLILLAVLVNIYTILTKKKLNRLKDICFIMIGIALLSALVLDTSIIVEWINEHYNFKLVFILTNLLYIITNRICDKQE